MKKKIIILFASKKEANQFLFHSEFKFKKEEDSYLSLINNLTVKVYITGIGKVNVINFLTKHNFDSDLHLVIKAGAVALLDTSLPLLTPFIPESVIYKNDELKINTDKLDSEIKKSLAFYMTDKKLVTVDEPLDSIEKISTFNNLTFADMETFHLLKEYKTFCFLPILVPTDYCNIKEFFLNLKNASVLLKEIIVRLIVG